MHVYLILLGMQTNYYIMQVEAGLIEDTKRQENHRDGALYNSMLCTLRTNPNNCS